MKNPISVKAAARTLGISERRVRAMIAEGTIRARKLGHVWMVDEGQLKNVRVYRKAGRPISR